MAKAIRLHETGGPDVLSLEDIPVGRPGPREVRLRQSAVGLNYIDTYHRTGLYPIDLPSGLGLEAAGVIEEVGEEVTDLAVGDRVAYMTGPIGAYSEARLIPADKVIKLPLGIDDKTAAAGMLKACTVEYLVRRTFHVKHGQTVLWHAAAGGVGLIACQWLKALGARVIGTAGSEEKAALARAHGCEEVILYRREDIVRRVLDLTEGAGVPVVYDGVGQATFEQSLACLAPRGMLVSFGNASGAIREIPMRTLAKGSIFLTRPSLLDYYAQRRDFEEGCQTVFDRLLAGDIKVEINQIFDLKDAADAHRALENRETTGSTILIP